MGVVNQNVDPPLIWVDICILTFLWLILLKMEKTVLLSAALLCIFSLLAHGLTLEIPQVKVFYVKATVSPTTECPSGDSPCHSLQYYANHSNFTNNSRFLFLEGEHHLDSVVTISNVANLSLVGLSSGVEILCKSVQSGFHVEKFIGLNIENMAIANCTGSENASLSLIAGSDVNLNYIAVTTSSGCVANGIVAMNIVGAFSIVGSTFFTPNGSNILVHYLMCNGNSHFNFSNNTLSNPSEGTELDFSIYCSNVQITLKDSFFENNKPTGMKIDYSVLTNNSFLVHNSIFKGLLTVIMCMGSCDKANLDCGSNFLRLTGISLYFGASFEFILGHTKECTIIVENSTFSNLSVPVVVEFENASESVQVVFDNVTLTNSASTPCIKLDHVSASLVNCRFGHNLGSVIQAINSRVVFQGTNSFKNNSAPIGGGIQLSNSYMYLEPHTHILFENNHAGFVGGAIYADSATCFFHVESPALSNTIQVNFSGNTAELAGSSVYGRVESCCENNTTCTKFYDIFNTTNSEKDPSAIVSDVDPSDICLCDDGKHKPNCSYANTAYETHAYPGQDFAVRLAVVSSRFNGVVPGAVHAYISSFYNATLGSSQSSQTSGKPYCVNFNYSVNSAGKIVAFMVIPEKFVFQKITTNFSSSHLSISVHLLNCPLGFHLSSVTGSCVCDPKLNGIKCNIKNQTFLRSANSWIGFINKSSTECNKTGVMFHPNCPIGYCLPRVVSINSNTSDSQCEPHRTGLLCGECEDGYSLTLGNQMCRKCSNTYLLLILPFAVAGLFLVVVLFALNLTVTEGSINGLIFYANVMAMNHTTFLSGKASYLYTFLAWLNLDLGINTCLFGGMDGYAETWLQFVFPVYLWVIILAVVLFYNKFRANGLGGKNAVQVLTTLLLLSYTKLQRTVVTILSFTWLEYPDGVVHYVWLYDANVEFFKGKHLYLSIASILVLVFLIVPYTLCLAFFQQLQACSGHRLFQWVNKLKPVFDAYAGPYKDKYRFWTGMLLVVRTLLIILFTINTAGSIEYNLLITLVVSCILLLANTNGAYKKWPCNYLESFFYLQLVVFAGAALYTRSTNSGITAVADTSIGLSLTVFLAVVGYYIICLISSLKAHYYRLQGYADVEEYVHDRMA